MGYVPVNPPDFGQQYAGARPRNARPASPYQRYLFDLYGPARRDLFLVWNYGLLAAVVALIIILAVLLTGGPI